MRPRRGFLAVVGFGVLGLAVTAGAVFAFRVTILESWFLWRLDSKNGAVRLEAIRELGELRSARAAPRLTDLLSRSVAARTVTSESDRLARLYRLRLGDQTPEEAESERALVRIGERAVPALITELGKGNTPAQIYLEVLQQIGPPAIPAAPALLRLFTIDHMLEREIALTLQAMGPALRPLLLESLREQKKDVHALRRFLSLTLRIDREALKDVLSVLEVVPDLELLGAVSPALAEAGPDSVKVFSDALRKGNPRLSLIAAQALHSLSLSNPFPELHSVLRDLVVPALASNLECAEKSILSLSAGVLEQLGDLALPAAPALLRLLGEGEAEVRAAANGALGAIGPPVLPALIGMLRDDREEQRRWVEGAIIRVGVQSGGAGPALLEALKEDDWRVASSSAIVLGALQSSGQLGDTTRALSALEEAARSPQPAVREAAAAALAFFDR